VLPGWRKENRPHSLLRWERQIQKLRLREAVGNDEPRKICPALAAVEHDAVRSSNDLIRMRKHMVWTERQVHFHLPTSVRRNFQDGRLEASAVRHRLVEPPSAAAHAPG